MHCATGCQLGKHRCWGRAHPELCEKAATDPRFAESVKRMPPHPVEDFGPIRRIIITDPCEGLPLRIRPWEPGGTIRIGLVGPNLNNIGGTERWMLDLIRATSKAPFQWVGVAFVEGYKPVQSLIETIEKTCPVRFGYEAIAGLGQGADVIVSWGVNDTHMLLGAESGCRTVLVSHNHPISSYTVANLRDACRATAVAAVCREAVESFPANEQPRAQVIYNTADVQPPSLTREEQWRAWGVPEGRKVVGFLGRICHQKYAEGFVAAIASLPPEYVGVMVGQGAEYVDDVIAENGIGSRIIRPGMTEHPGNALAAFDVLLMPSRYEAHSIAFTEAWLARVPVISTAISFTAEHPELIRVVPQEASGAELAAAVRADLEDADGTRRRVEHARRFAETELSFDRFRDSWREFLIGTVENTATGFAPETPTVAYVSPLAHLTDDQIRQVERCPHKRQRVGCCGGPIDFCGAGYFGGERGQVQTAQCVECVTSDWAR